MIMKRRRVWWVSGILALALLTGTWVAFWKTQESATRLTIKITGLPGKAQPIIAVTGANGFKRSVTASTTLGVPPGSVRLAPAPVKAANATYYTPDEVLTTPVDRGESARVTVDYRIAVSEKARILDYADPGLAKTTTGRDKELLFRSDAESAQNLKVGDILLAAEGPKTPHGLLRKVVGRERRGDLLAVETSSARLSEAMPKAVLRFTRTPSDAAAAGSNMQPAAYRADDDPGPGPQAKPWEGEFSLKMDTWQQELKSGAKVACGTGIPLVKVEATWPDLDLSGSEIGFNLRDVVWADVHANVHYSARVTLGTPHGAQCSYELISKDWIKLPGNLGKVAQLVRVGPFRVQPQMKFIAGLEVKAATGMKVVSGGEQDWKVKSRLSLLPYASATVDGPAPFTTSISGAGEGKLKGKGGVRFGLEASDPIEVFVTEFNLDAALAVEAGIDPEKHQGKVEGFLEGGAAVDFKPGEFKARQIGLTITSPKYTIWESDELMPALAFATDSAIMVKSGTGGPETVTALPAGMAASQLTWAPDGKQLAWTTAATELGQSGGLVYLADLTTGNVGSWECGGCQISFIGNKLLSEWNTLDGEDAGFAWYRLGETEPSTMHLENPEILHQGQTDEEALEVARNYCGTGGCSTMDLYGGAANSGDSLMGIRWNDCRTKVFRVNSRLQVSALTVANLGYDSVVEPGPDGRWLMSAWNSGGCEGVGEQAQLELAEVTKNGQLSTAPVPSGYQSWEACYLWYDEKKTPHAVVAPAIDDGDIWADEEPCVQQPPRKFRTLMKQGNSWKETSDSVLLRRTRGDWSAELHAGGRLTAENPKQEQRMHISERVRTFAWSQGAK
ncbi:hypothetical protein [Streptomyces griseorubens]|uniref:hypothetical protein n=1 Tax=Streptomyces TaxID=1883 RepID=UPI001319C72D|nr:hypothetical protein [Streptomyces griseorubens]